MVNTTIDCTKSQQANVTETMETRHKPNHRCYQIADKVMMSPVILLVGLDPCYIFANTGF